MITIISGTNRPESRTLVFAELFLEQIRELGQEAQLLDLSQLNLSHFGERMYEAKAMAPALVDLQRRYMLEADKLAIFVPEYNGSYPGILKLFIDGISVNAYPQNLKEKVVALIGVASGRAGNLRGMDHLADTISHMGGWVLPNKLPLSGVESLLTGDRVSDEPTIAALKKHALQLIAAPNRNLI
jgi:NAD(P)H-dependent FMN reductase